MQDRNQIRRQGMLSPLWRLSRATEHIPFVLPLTLLAALTTAHGQKLDFGVKLGLVAVANVLAVVYAFMINDIADAVDDLANPQARSRNPISAGSLDRSTAHWAAFTVGALSLMLYALVGPLVLLVGAAILGLGDLYSRPPLRLKARPVVDIASHVLMLGGLLCLAGILAAGGTPGASWWLVGAATAFSGYGQLYNQLRDYRADQKAGLRNSADLMGLRWTSRAMILAAGLAALCVIAFIAFGDFPWWLGLAAPVGILLSLMISTARDARGSQAKTGGSWQQRGLFVLNFIAFSWLAVELLVPTL